MTKALEFPIDEAELAKVRRWLEWLKRVLK